MTSTSATFYLGLLLKPDIQQQQQQQEQQQQQHGGSSQYGGSGGGPPSGAGGGRRRRRLSAGEGSGAVEVVFPCLRPRLSLLRQVYQQLQPLLQADMDAAQAAAAAGGR